MPEAAMKLNAYQIWHCRNQHGHIAAGGRIVLKNQLSLVGDVEYTQGSGDHNHAAVGYLGLAYRF